mmetsp:Transcript_31975/g.41097  ORF Transcript_31975/g.41097 Transcript_31975/m.41097 type:complete len:241 (-) Transcript_31975:144-866(-)
MTTRAQIIDLMLSESDNSLAQLHSLLAESMVNPTMKLTKTGNLQTKTIRVPTKWIPPPTLGSSSSSDGTQSKNLATSQKKIPNIKLSTTSKTTSGKLISDSSQKKLQKPNTMNILSPSASSSPSQTIPSVAGSEDGKFCICGGLDDNPDETFIKCSIGRGGCNGWIHLRCANLSESIMDDIILNQKQPKYTCTLCQEFIQNNKTIKKIENETKSVPVQKKRGQTQREALMKKLKSGPKRY